MTDVVDRGVGIRLGEVTGANPRIAVNKLQLPAPESMVWRKDAACVAPGVAPEWFFSDNATEAEWAIAICRMCPVVEECAKERARIDAPGVWAGVRWVMAAGGTTRPWRRVRGGTEFVKQQAARRARVLRLRDEGYTLREMGRILGCSHRTVSNDLRAMGVIE